MNETISPERIRKLKKSYLAVFVIYLTVYYGLIALLPQDYVATASDLMSPGGIIISLIILYQAIKLCPQKKIRRIMFIFLGGAAAYLLGDLQIAYAELIKHSMYFGSGGDVFYTTSALLILIGFFLNIPQKSKNSTVRTGFDILIIMAIYLSLEAQYVMLPVMSDRTLTFADKFTSLMYPIFDVGLLMAILLIFFNNGKGKKRFVDRYMVIIALVQLFADQVFSIQFVLGSYESGSWLDPLWVAAFIGLGIVALRLDEFLLFVPEWIENIMISDHPQGSINKYTVLTYGFTIIFLAIWGYQYFEKDPLSIGVITIIFLVIIRQYFALRENRELTQTLLQSNQDLYEAKACIEREARIDYLTRLFNRRYIDRAILELQKLAQQNSSPFSVLVMDVDYFKKINDQYGHNTGDQVLQQIAAIINMNVRQDDIAARWGGEEFIIILPDTDEPLAYSIGERIRMEIERFNFTSGIDQDSIRLSVSIGVSQATIIEQDFSKVILRADQGMYEAKCAGRNRTVIKRAG